MASEVPLKFPVMTVVDDAGAIVDTVTTTGNGVSGDVFIASCKDIDGTAVAGITIGTDIKLHLCGGNVVLEVATQIWGEFWVQLTISKAAHTFTGLNAAPRFFLTQDPSFILARRLPKLDSAVALWNYGGMIHAGARNTVGAVVDQGAP